MLCTRFALLTDQLKQKYLYLVKYKFILDFIEGFKQILIFHKWRSIKVYGPYS